MKTMSWPEQRELHDVVDAITYKPRWGVYLEWEEDDLVPTLVIISDTENSLDPVNRIRVKHAFLVPPATYNRDNWAAWVFDCFIAVERHEAGEFFKINGFREFAPHHGNGEDPYRTWHVSDWATANKRSGQD